MTYYHASDGEAHVREGIAKNGLVVWPTSARGAIYSLPGVWLFSGIEDAHRHGALSYTDYVIYAVYVDGLPLVDDVEYPIGTAYVCTEDIPTDRIEIIFETI